MDRLKRKGPFEEENAKEYAFKNKRSRICVTGINDGILSEKHYKVALPIRTQKDRKLSSPAGLRRRRKRTHATGVHPLPPAVLCPNVRGVSETLRAAAGVKPCVSACKPLCAVFVRESRVYTLS